MSEYSPAKTVEYPSVFCEKHLKDSLHLYENMPTYLSLENDRSLKQNRYRIFG